MSDVPTISITNPEMESENYNMASPVAGTPPGSPTVFDMVKDMDPIDPDTTDDHPFDDNINELTQLDEQQDPAPDTPEPKDGQPPVEQEHQPQQEDQDQPPTPVPESEPTVRDYFRDKCILLTGATGFVGKAVLWKLLSTYHDELDKIFVLLRPNAAHHHHIHQPQSPQHHRRHNVSAAERVADEIWSNKAFVALRRSMGPSLFDRMVRDKVQPIDADLAQPDLGLSDENRKLLAKHIHIVLHCAGTVDGNERLDLAIKTNVLGTMNLVELANEAMHLSAFVHLSPLQVISTASGAIFEDRLLPLPDMPETLLSNILEANLEDLPTMFENYKQLYPNTYFFSKSLAEHMLVKEVEKKQSNGGHQFPIAIVRSSPIGPSACEPMIGWADGVNGANGTMLLTGRGMRGIQPNSGDAPADIVPVDYAARLLLGCVAHAAPPAPDFSLPVTDVLMAMESMAHRHQQQQQRQSDGSQPTSQHRRQGSTVSSTSQRDSGASSEEDDKTSVCRTSDGTHASSKTSLRANSLGTPVFPYIYHMTTTQLRCLTWRNAYEPIRHYWTRATRVQLPPAQTYFSSGQGGLTRAKTMMNTLRSAASTYMANNAGPTPGASAGVVDHAARSRKRSSQRLSRCLDKAAKLSTTTRLSFSKISGVSIVDGHTTRLMQKLQTTPELDPHALVPEDADETFWKTYFMDACYGIHYYVCAEPDLRLPMPLSGWHCALQEEDMKLLDRVAVSTVFSPDQVARRTERMIAQVKEVMNHSTLTRNQKDDSEWLSDLDDSLDDFCQDTNALAQSEKDKRLVLGKWRKKVGSNDESVKIVVLNDKRVNQAIHQITQNAGVQKQTAVNEAMKILMRMSERTQLAFVWFAGYFMKSLFDDMFENVRVRDDSIRKIRDSTLGKRVVYVPVSKSVLDPLIIWYITIRYNLPVPSFACDEALAHLGPISDVYRLAGAYYVKRDPTKRSPLNSAVMAAYTQVLLREHGALSLCLEKTRTRNGKYQEPYNDGMVEMVIESTLQSNQPRSPSVSRVNSGSLNNGANNSPPLSPDTPTTVQSPTMSVDSTTGFVRKVHRDVVVVPINITYESIPELPYLIDLVLDQHPQRQQTQKPNGGLPTISQGVVRPSEAMDKRKEMLDGLEAPRKYGRVLFGVGDPVSVQEQAEGLVDEKALVDKITEQVHTRQRKALVVSPVSLVAAVVLYGRATAGVCLGKIKDMVEWLRVELMMREYQVDWQDGEDIDAIVLYAFRMLDETRNIVVEGKDITDDTNIRVNDHADNVMTLSYYANQVVDVFLLDAFFSVVYLSFTENEVSEDEFIDRFRFLVQMLEREFVLSWNLDEHFNWALATYEQRKVVRRTDNRQLQLLANMDNNPVRYEQLMFMASLVYPTIDSYWITSCSLSALEAVPMLPRSIVPLLSQWIATHLITGRRTIYREVLSTESSRTAADVFMGMGFLTEIQAKERLSPDAQILLHELGIPTTEALLELSGQNNDCGQKPVSPVDPEGMMKALMAQIQMNRANSNMADLCQQIDSYRLGAVSQRETFQNKQVFQKCLKQIKGILQGSAGFAKKRNIELDAQEDGLVQLVYALRTSSSPSIDRFSQQGSRALRRISEAYNLRR